MAIGYSFRLELEDGTPADPPAFRSATLKWKVGDVIPLGRRTLRVVAIRGDDADQPPVLVVDELPGTATSAATV